MNIADIIVILIIGVFAFIGYKRGLLLSIYSFGSYLIAFFLGFILRKPVSSFLASTSIPDRIHENVYNKLLEMNESKAGELTVKAKDYIEGLNYPAHIENFLKRNVEDIETERLFTQIADEISTKVTSLIVSILAFLIVVIIVLIAMLVIKMLIKTARKLPVIKQVDSVGGLLIGIVEGFLLIAVVILVIYMFSSRESFKPVINIIEDSLIANFLFEKNWLATILSKLKLTTAISFSRLN